MDMLVQFPIAHADELLGSALARFVQRLGIKEDKVALELLFGARLIVPSALFQGHVDQLLEHVGHIWLAEAGDVLESHTLSPLFRPFVARDRYESLLTDLRGSSTSFCKRDSGDAILKGGCFVR